MYVFYTGASQVALLVKNLPANVGDTRDASSIPGQEDRPDQEDHFHTYKIKVKVLVSQLCLTVCNLMDCSPPGSSVHGIL